jgi:hypothetical protein
LENTYLIFLFLSVVEDKQIFIYASQSSPYLGGGAHARGRQVSGAAKYFGKINFTNYVSNERKKENNKKKIVCFIML